MSTGWGGGECRRAVHGRRRSGQILFLEFVGTLPIFALLLYTATTFHWWYLHTRENYGAAHFVKDREVDHHWAESGEHTQLDDKVVRNMQRADNEGPPSVRDEDDPLATVDPPVNDDIQVRRYGTLSYRRIQVPLWRDEARPTGLDFGTRDSWSHRDLRDKLETSPGQRAQPGQRAAVSDDTYKSMPRVFYSDKYGADNESEGGAFLAN